MLKPVLAVLLPGAIVLTTMVGSAGSATRQEAAQMTLDECSACHMAYHPSFLPQRSWRKIMRTLDNHFGEDATLDEQTRQVIEDFLVANAPRNVRRVASSETPLRISELPWFTHEHGRRLRNRAKNDPNIGSISNCQGCHRNAQAGYFDDD